MKVIGACSWSLQPADVNALIAALRETDITCVQLALDPLRTGEWPVDETVSRLGDAGIHIASGMMGMVGEDYSTLETIKETGGVRPDEHWRANRQAAAEIAALAAALDVPLVTLHAGFIPHDANDPVRETMLSRLRTLTDLFGQHGVRLAFETGQETAGTLLDALDALDRPEVGVNFDPANMILYDMGDPVDALQQLGPRVAQIHIKDAERTKTPGTWGAEVATGSGEVDWPAFFRIADALPDVSHFMIEREAGDDRIGDIAQARTVIQQHSTQTKESGIK